MSRRRIEPAARPLHGTLRMPGDKSIAHRVLLLGTMARGATRLGGAALGEDNRATLAACRRLGVAIEEDGSDLVVRGRGLDGLTPADGTIDCANSGTTMRLLTGILAGRPFASRLDGDPSLRRRPMARVVEPLARMGASIVSEPGNGCAPLRIEGRSLRGAAHTLPIASAQVKSALLLAGLQAEGETTIAEPGPSRDHTERLLPAFGGAVTRGASTCAVHGPQALRAASLAVPGDVSSAAFFLVAASVVPGSELRLAGVGVNPTRTGALDVLRAMGAAIAVEDLEERDGEPRATIVVRAAPLSATTVGGETMVRAIDEFPVLCIAAACAEGTTEFRDAAELRLKESDRIAAMAAALAALGVAADETPDGLAVHGAGRPRGGTVAAGGDHRVAMAAAVAGLASAGGVTIDGAECADVSYPRFYEDLAAAVAGRGAR